MLKHNAFIALALDLIMTSLNVDQIINEIKRQHMKDLEAEPTPEDKQTCLTFILAKMVGMPIEATLTILDCRYI